MSRLGPYDPNTIVVGDCLDVMAQMPDGCIDLVLSDLPYGKTQCKWDVIIPLDRLWEQYQRIVRGNTAIVLTASQPFTSMLVYSNLKMFKYCWVWEKTRATGHFNAKKQPMRAHEDIVVFYDKQCVYNPQMTTGHIRRRATKDKSLNSEVYNANTRTVSYDSTDRYPRSVLVFKASTQLSSLHPTQKPIALFKYLIKTYSNESDLVFDGCIGSGTTAIAADRLGRKFFGCDINPDYVKMALKRLGDDCESRAQLPLQI